MLTQTYVGGDCQRGVMTATGHSGQFTASSVANNCVDSWRETGNVAKLGANFLPQKIVHVSYLQMSHPHLSINTNGNKFLG